MGDRQISKKVKMKLFAVLAFAVAARQVDKYDNDVEIGGPCTHDGALCGLENTECNAEKKCACKEGFVEDSDKINCKAPPKVLNKDCDDATQCGINAVCKKTAPTGYQATRIDGKICACPDGFVANADDVNCDALPAINELCTEEVGCGDKLAECDKTLLTCQCKAGHTADDKVCKVDEATEGSAAFYSVATTFMALILA